MLLQPRVPIVISTKCLRTRPMWARCHLHDVDDQPVKLPRAATPNANQVRNLPLPVEVGGLRETALSMTVAQIPQPQEDVSPRPLQIPKRESEHHLPDLPQICPQPQSAVGGPCAMNPPSLPNTQLCWCVTHCGDPVSPNREEAWQHLVPKHCTDRVPRSQCHTSNSRDPHHVLLQIGPPTRKRPTLANPIFGQSNFGQPIFVCVVLCCGWCWCGLLLVLVWLLLVLCLLFLVVVCCCGSCGVCCCLLLWLWFVFVWLLVWTTFRRTSPPPDRPKFRAFFRLPSPISLFLSHCVFSRGISVVFVKTGTLKCARLGSRAVV